MILAIRTDSPEAKIVLVKDDAVIDSYVWTAHRTLARDLLKVIRDRMHEHGMDWHDLSGIVIYRGPGSFTGLRIGITVANAVAHSEQLPIVGTGSEDWMNDGLKRLNDSEDDKVVLPEYGSPANITKPKK